MAHLWVRDKTDRWAVMPLENDAFSLSGAPPRPILRQLGEGGVLSDVLLIRTRDVESSSWVLIAGKSSGVSINGIPLATGLCVVSDRDRIRIPNADDIYFSTECLARIEEVPGDDKPLCPRCKQEIHKGTSAVRCPTCRVWHHEVAELNCWTYADVCALCAQPTDLNAGFRWTPEEEEL